MLPRPSLRSLIKSRDERSIDRRTTDLERLRDGGRLHAVGLHPLDLGGVVSEDVARELRRRCDLQMRDVPSSIQDFVERHEGHAWRQLTLRLV